VFEEWEDRESIDAHMGTPHMAAFIGSMGDLGVTAVDISTYAVSEKAKLM
jgi:quinol monooxygenase YgiN